MSGAMVFTAWQGGTEKKIEQGIGTKEISSCSQMFTILLYSIETKVDYHFLIQWFEVNTAAYSDFYINNEIRFLGRAI